MKKLQRLDYLLIALLTVMVAALTFLPDKGRGKNVPADVIHHSIYEGSQAGRSQAETELLCSTCHAKASMPLPQGHPPKEQCLICHLLA